MSWVVSYRGHYLNRLCMQIGSLQAHMGFGSAMTLNSEISHLSIGLTFVLHVGQYDCPHTLLT